MHMRTTIQLFVFFLAAMAGLTLQAQPGGGRAQNPEQRAEQQTATMTEKLSLSEAQAGKVKEINLKYAKKMQEARDQANGDWEAMRGTMGTMRTEQDSELQTVLTEEQWQQWIKYREEMRANRGNWGNGNAPSGDKPAPPPDGADQKPKKNKNKNKNKSTNTDTSNKQ